MANALFEPVGLGAGGKPQVLPSACLFNVTVGTADWQLFMKYVPMNGDDVAPPPLDFVLTHGDHVNLRAGLVSDRRQDVGARAGFHTLHICWTCSRQSGKRAASICSSAILINRQLSFYVNRGCARWRRRADHVGECQSMVEQVKSTTNWQLLGVDEQRLRPSDVHLEASPSELPKARTSPC